MKIKKTKDKIKCVVVRASQKELGIAFLKNTYYKEVNNLISEFIMKSAGVYRECFADNKFTNFEIDTLIDNFNEKYTKLVKKNNITLDVINIKDLYFRNKKTKRNPNFKGEERTHLHKYLIEVIEEKNRNTNNYYDDFYNFFYTYYNPKYELNDSFFLVDGPRRCNEEDKQRRNKIQTVNGLKRIYDYKKLSVKGNIDLNNYYQKLKKTERMQSLIELKMENHEEFNLVIDEVFRVFALDEFANKIESEVIVKNKGKFINKITSEKLIRLYKAYYKETICKNFEANISEENNNVDSIKFVMRLLNVYMKGRYTKCTNAASKGQLTKLFLKDIYDEEKIRTKFERSLESKMRQFELKEKKASVQALNSIQKQKDKMLQTYFMKLISKIDYCSKLPVSDQLRVNDIFNTESSEKMNLFNSNNQVQFYFLEYFPNALQYIDSDKDYAPKLFNSLHEIKNLRNEVLHAKKDLTSLDTGLNIKSDIEFLNKQQKQMILNKFSSNNIEKYFDVGNLNGIYKSIISDKNLDYNYYNIHLPKFSKVFARLLRDEHNKYLGCSMSKVLENQSQDTEVLEQKQAIRYLLQTFYYYGFACPDIKVRDIQSVSKDKKVSLEDYIVENQRTASIKGNSRKENNELVELIADEFREYIEKKVKIKEIIIEKREGQELSKILDDIEIKEVEYNESNVLVVLSYFLDSAQLSQLIHDTKRLLVNLNNIDGKAGVEVIPQDVQDILVKNIAMLNLNLMYKDLVKNINYSSSEIEKEIKKLGIDSPDSDEVKKKFEEIFKNKKETYIEYLNMAIKSGSYKDGAYQQDGKKQCLYLEGENLIIHSGIELFLKYNLSEFFEKYINHANQKITSGDIERFAKYKQSTHNIETIENKVNEFANNFNNKIKNEQSVAIKKMYAEEMKANKDPNNKEAYTYKDIIKLNDQKQRYHYLNNKIKFNNLNTVNKFIDEVLAKLNKMMMYWERDANIIVEYYETNEGIKSDGRYQIGRIKNYKSHCSEILKDLDKLVNNNMGDKYKEIKYGKDSITAIHIRNYLSHNNYYVRSNDRFSQKFSLLELINMVHSIMEYNTKYQNDVLDVFNKLLHDFRIGNESNPKNRKPLRYDKENNQIIINEEYFKPRTHNYFDELNLVSEEYCEMIKQVLNFKQ